MSPPMVLMRRERKPPKEIKLVLLKETRTDAQWPRPGDVLTVHAEGREELVIQIPPNKRHGLCEGTFGGAVCSAQSLLP